MNKLQATKDNRIMKLLGVTELRHLVAHTNHGELTLMIRLGEDEASYRYVLDAVPVSDEVNGELKELLKS